MAADLTERAREHAVTVLRRVADDLAVAPRREMFETLSTMGGVLRELEVASRGLQTDPPGSRVSGWARRIGFLWQRIAGIDRPPRLRVQFGVIAPDRLRGKL
jgi:hypothetical protein